MYGYSKYRSFKRFTPSRTTGVFNNRSIYRVQKVGNTYKKGSVKASYSKDEEKSIMIAQLALVLLNMVSVMRIVGQQQTQSQVLVLKQIVGTVSILINH